jgi:hypothetical protein
MRKAHQRPDPTPTGRLVYTALTPAECRENTEANVQAAYAQGFMDGIHGLPPYAYQGVHFLFRIDADGEPCVVFHTTLQAFECAAYAKAYAAASDALVALSGAPRPYDPTEARNWRRVRFTVKTAVELSSNDAGFAFLKRPAAVGAAPLKPQAPR